MSGMIARLKGLAAGHGGVEAIASLSADLRALQQRVDELQRQVHDLAAHEDEARTRQVEEFDRIRSAITTVGDDLSERIAALQDRRADTAS